MFDCLLVSLYRPLVFCVCISFCAVFLSLADKQSKIGDRKLESWTLRNVEDCRCFCFVSMMLTILLYVHKDVMLDQRFCMLLIRL